MGPRGPRTFLLVMQAGEALCGEVCRLLLPFCIHSVGAAIPWCRMCRRSHVRHVTDLGHVSLPTLMKHVTMSMSAAPLPGCVMKLRSDLYFFFVCQALPINLAYVESASTPTLIQSVVICGHAWRHGADMMFSYFGSTIIRHFLLSCLHFGLGWLRVPPLLDASTCWLLRSCPKRRGFA